jgi:hypothetical protein
MRYGRGNSRLQVTIRYLAQVLRGAAPAQVFAQDLLAFRLAESNPLVVGINLVEPEDNRQILATTHSRCDSCDGCMSDIRR